MLSLESEGGGMFWVFGFGCEIGFHLGSCFGRNAKAMTCPGFVALAVGLAFMSCFRRMSSCQRFEIMSGTCHHIVCAIYSETVRSRLRSLLRC